MEDAENETSSGSNLVPVALAVLAIVLGGAGLYFGMTANQRLNPIHESMEADSGNAARMEKQLAGLETQLAELSAQSVDLKKTIGRMRVYANQGEQTVRQVAGGVKENRDEIVKMAKRLNELAVSSTQTRPEAPTVAETSAPSRTSARPAEAEDAGPGGTYTIKSGDYFAKIASELGIELQALIDANPDADPRRLRIGQVINVPGN
jgi:LysM repeat protein